MLKIRMQRIGKKNDPAYRVVVLEHTRGPKAGNFLERVGSYHPKTKVRTLDAGRITHWISKGAQPSGTVHNMLISEGIIKGEKINVLPKKTPQVKEEAPAEEAAPVEEATDAPAAEAADTPAAEEKPAEEAPAAEEVAEEAPAEDLPTEDSAQAEEKKEE